MPSIPPRPIEAIIVALPETSGSALYGMVDVLSAAGNLWAVMAVSGAKRHLFRTRIASIDTLPFRCLNGIPIEPDLTISEDPASDIVIVPDIWLRPEESVTGRYEALMKWLRKSYGRGAAIYSACSGSIILAESGLLDGREATSHWGYEDLFRRWYPEVRFRPEPTLCFADRAGRIVTAGGATAWHDLAIHIIAKYCGPGEALRVAQVFLLKLHSEGQLPYASHIRHHHHADSVVRACERWLEQNFRSSNVVARAVLVSQIPERSLKRRFSDATGSSLIEYVQRLRVEDAKRQLENADKPIDEICTAVGYEETAFFRGCLSAILA